MLLTPMLKIAGMQKILCNTIDIKQNKMPFSGPKVTEIEEIVNPKIVPLNNIIIKTYTNVK